MNDKGLFTVVQWKYGSGLESQHEIKKFELAIKITKDGDDLIGRFRNEDVY